MIVTLLLAAYLMVEKTGASPVVNGFAEPIEPDLGEFPFHVNLLQDVSKPKIKYWSFCGGSLIHPRWVLTAAHCIQVSPDTAAQDPKKTFLAMGSIWRNASGAQIIGVDKFIVHESYLQDLESDLALIRASKPFQIGPDVKLIKIAKTTENLMGQTAYLTGFGVINDAMEAPERLRKAIFTIDENWKCLDTENEEIHLCAVSWVEEGGKACKGDSGGPLFIKENGKFLQIGITSRLAILPICQFNLNNSVYTKVSAFIDWIRANSGVKNIN